MSQNERADYDDQPQEPTPVPKELKHAGTAWLVTWYWFLAGILIIMGERFIQLGWLKFNDLMLACLAHVVGAGIFILNGHLVRRGYWKLLGVVVVGSVLSGIYVGTFVFFLGLVTYSGMYDFEGSPTLRMEILGMAMMIFSAGFVVLGFVACNFTTKYFSWRSHAVNNE